jgi:hypothetical protein
LSELTTPVANVCGKEAQLIALAKFRKTTLGRRRKKKYYTVINFRVERERLNVTVAKKKGFRSKTLNSAIANFEFSLHRKRKISCLRSLSIFFKIKTNAAV